jgi:Ni,Fe-hydrogenase I small subunit
VDANAPCTGCTDPKFPDVKPFYRSVENSGSTGGDEKIEEKKKGKKKGNEKKDANK